MKKTYVTDRQTGERGRKTYKVNNDAPRKHR